MKPKKELKSEEDNIEYKAMIEAQSRIYMKDMYLTRKAELLNELRIINQELEKLD